MTKYNSQSETGNFQIPFPSKEPSHEATSQECLLVIEKSG